MAYLGKEYKFESEENYDAFIEAVGKHNEAAKPYLAFKPNHKLVKNGDEYKVIISIPDQGFQKEINFKPGVPFEESIGQGGLKCKSLVTIDGDTFTQVQDYGNASVTIKREYNADKLKVVSIFSKNHTSVFNVTNWRGRTDIKTAHSME